jgi:hypothetical protein
VDRTAPVPDARFEYRDLIVPLRLCLVGRRYPTRDELAAFHGYDGVVTEYLGRAAREGWFPDEAADWDSLAAAGRFTTEVDPDLGGSGEEATMYRSVTIRLRRLNPRFPHPDPSMHGGG